MASKGEPAGGGRRPMRRRISCAKGGIAWHVFDTRADDANWMSSDLRAARFWSHHVDTRHVTNRLAAVVAKHKVTSTD
jgi:hypothetical protein